MTGRRRRWFLCFVLALSLVGTGCFARQVAPPERSPGHSSLSVTQGGTGPTAGARPPCLRIRTAPSPLEPTGKLPANLADEAKQVEAVRGLSFTRAVSAEPVSKAEIAKLLRQGEDASFPKDEARRNGLTWSTIGVIPKGTDLRKAVDAFQQGEVIGFYDNQTHRLVFVGSSSPTPFQRFTLAHEFTHALQDQHFNLSRIDDLDRTCQDERVEAMISLAEGDAVETSIQWARDNLTSTEIAKLQTEANSFSPPPKSVPAFVQNLLTFPYPNGQAFVESLLNRGGEQAVDEAFKNPPDSSEQILHPEKYPSEQPTDVEVADFGAKLGSDWKDLEFEDVGEAFLRLMLELRLPSSTADAAAAGWAGGQYRGWSDSNGHIAVVMDTVWDTANDAKEFADAMGMWLGDQTAVAQPLKGNRVRVLFASDQVTLGRLVTATSS